MSGRTQVSVGLIVENLQEEVNGNPRTSAWALVGGVHSKSYCLEPGHETWVPDALHRILWP